jgi:hypothetical protein
LVRSPSVYFTKEIDKKNEERLRLSIQDIQNKMTGLRDKKKANNAYQSNPTANGGVFIDYTK